MNFQLKSLAHCQKFITIEEGQILDASTRCEGIRDFYKCQKNAVDKICGRDASIHFRETIKQFSCGTELWFLGEQWKFCVFCWSSYTTSSIVILLLWSFLFGFKEIYISYLILDNCTFLVNIWRVIIHEKLVFIKDLQNIMDGIMGTGR